METAVPHASTSTRFAIAAGDGPARLLNRDFVLLWQGQLVSQLGDQAFAVAMLFWTLEASGSASVMGLVMAAAFVPVILLSPFAGTLADRHSRLRIVVVCDVGRGVLMLLLAVCFWTCPLRWLIPILLAVVFANGMLTAFFDAAITAAIPDLTPDRHLAGANSFQLFSRQGSTLAGQALGGIAFQAIGAPVLFFVNGLTFLFSGVTEAFVRLPARPRAPDETSAMRAFVESTRQGLRYVVQREGLLRFIAAVSVFNCLIIAIAALLPIYVSDYLGGGARWYGFLVAGLSAGSMIGCVAASSVNRLGMARYDRQARAWVLVSLFGGMASALALLGQTRTHSIALALMVTAGAFAGLVGVTVLTILQRTTPEHLRGRVLGLNTTLTRALAPVGIVVAGIVADCTGRNIPIIYAACGALAAATAVLLLGSRPSRAFLVSDSTAP